MSLLTRRGVLVDEEVKGGSTYLADADADSDEARSLRPLQAAACTYRIGVGLRGGQRVLAVQGAIGQDAVPTQALCADHQGFSLHTAVRCGADERQRLEQLCRYITRPALANERVQINSAAGGAKTQVGLARWHHPHRDLAVGFHAAPGRASTLERSL